jgi:hypothetical protein
MSSAPGRDLPPLPSAAGKLAGAQRLTTAPRSSVVERILATLDKTGEGTTLDIIAASDIPPNSVYKCVSFMHQAGEIEVCGQRINHYPRGYKYASLYRRASDDAAEAVMSPGHPADRAQYETEQQAAKFAERMGGLRYDDSPASLKAVTHSKVDLRRAAPLTASSAA